MKQEEYITKKELHDEICKAEGKYEDIVREKVMLAKTDLSKQLHKHITARFESSKKQRDDDHAELKDLIKTSNKTLSDKIDPIAKNYAIVGTLAKWLWICLAFITLFFTALANAKSGIHQLFSIFT